jgi:hypothetical protein
VSHQTIRFNFLSIALLGEVVSKACCSVASAHENPISEETRRQADSSTADYPMPGTLLIP